LRRLLGPHRSGAQRLRGRRIHRPVDDAHPLWFLFFGSKPGEHSRAVPMGAGWVIDVVVAE